MERCDTVAGSTFMVHDHTGNCSIRIPGIKAALTGLYIWYQTSEILKSPFCSEQLSEVLCHYGNVNPFTTVPQVIFLLLENDNLGTIN